MGISTKLRSWRSGLSRITESDWATITILIGIFFLALFLRSFFGFETATQEGFLLSGGSDSYYHKRVIDYVVATGHQPYIDPMLNYPIGLHSVRPPLYDWSVAVSGIAFSPFFGSVDVSVWYSFLFSTAIWGALTIFPLYFMTKEAFGKRVGLIAAFLLAIMPAHLQRTPLTNGDHDAFVLFFVVLTFYFFLKALKNLKEKQWITSWRRPRAVLGQTRDFFVENRKAVIYSAMAGLSIGAIALAWTGFSYVIVILVVFYIIMILINRLKNRDSFGLIVCFVITIGLALLVSFPFYAAYLRIEAWFDTPFYMLIISAAFGLLFLVTNKYPWMLVIPTLFAVFAIGLLVLSIISPSIVHNFFSGFGYFLRTKAYETIAEAQPPNFSHLVLSFGAITFFLALFGLAWSVVLIPKKVQTDYIFIVIWIALSIYMAIAAARFIFNGAPAFAMSAAWVVVLALDKLDLKGARKTYRSIGGNRFTAFRKSVKIRHVIGALAAAFMIILPNVWFGMDAAIPFENKRDYDAQVYDAMPFFFRPGDYSEGSLWYLGAFGYSLPLKSRYWPTSYVWLSEQDSDVPIHSERPAILSWWDYGFEFVQEGKHPTVADNFLDGYQLAGNFIMSQSEKNAIALLCTRLIEGNYLKYNAAGYNIKNFDENMQTFFARYDLNASLFEDIIINPSNYVDAVLANPDKYEPRSADLSPHNAKYLYMAGVLTDKFDLDELAEFYHDLRATTGKSIRYFAVDTRMFPFSAQVTGIFYAPAKLSDHRIESGAPIDFYEIIAVSEFGAEFPIDEVPPGTSITDYKLVYKDMFFNSMFYRSFVGYSGKDIGQGEGIPGLSEDLAQQQIMPGWNLNHFKMVYRTSYYNPYPPAEVQNHTDAWRAINFEDAVEMQRQIQNGEANGTVDISSQSSLRNGVVIIKYYDGAYINGTITIDGKTPFSGVTVTVNDEFGVPHYTTTTDADGRYSTLAPFGDGILVTASIGPTNNLTSVGPTVLNTTKFNITDDQAMRLPQDMNGDGIYDYIITNDIEIEGGDLTGQIFIDLDRDGTLGSDDLIQSDVELVLNNKNVDISLEQTSNETGGYEFNSIYPGDYEVIVFTQGREYSDFSTTISAGEANTLDLNINSSVVGGKVLSKDLEEVAGAEVQLYDETNRTTLTTNSNETGEYEFRGLLYGNYSLGAQSGHLNSIPIRISVPINASNQEIDLTILPSGRVFGDVRLGGDSAPYVPLKFQSYDWLIAEQVTSDKYGNYEIILPEGTYSIYSTYYSESTNYAFLGKIVITKNESTRYDINLEKSVEIEGVAYQELINHTKIEVQIVLESKDGNGKIKVVTNNLGAYSARLPKREYEIKVTSLFYFFGQVTLNADTVYDIPLMIGAFVEGPIYYDINHNTRMEAIEGLEYVHIVFTDTQSRHIDVYSDEKGLYEVMLDTNGSYEISVDIPGYEPFSKESRNITEIRADLNITLVPLNVTLSGEVFYGGAPLLDRVIIQFLPVGEGAIEALKLSSTDGSYEVSLRPGDYEIVIDHQIDVAEKYQNKNQENLHLDIGEETHVRDIEVVRKFELNGTISLEGVAPSELIGVELYFEGPEEAYFTTNNTFSVYLSEGSYSVRTNFSYQGDYYVNITSIDMMGPQSIDIELEETVLVHGYVLYGGNSIGENLTVAFSGVAGGMARAQTASDGYYEIHLPSGDYTADVNHTTIESIFAIRYIRYLASSQLTVPSQGPISFDMNLTKILNNGTLFGKVRNSQGTTINTSLEFIGKSPSAIDTAVQSNSNGDYTTGLHPGNYSVYSVHGDDVYFDTLDIAMEEHRHQDFQLLQGYNIEGTLNKGTESVEGDIYIEDLNSSARLTVPTDPLGKFELTLPEGYYSISSNAMVLERGLDVEYTNITEIEVRTDRIIAVNLEKIKNYNVKLTWDPLQWQKIGGNETVVYTIVLSNTGNVEDTYELEGKPESWTFEFNPAVVPANFGDYDSLRYIEASITSPLNPLVEHEDVKISVRSQNSSITDTVIVEIGIYQQIGLELSLSDITPVFSQETAIYRFDIMNTGNDEDNYTVIVANQYELATRGWSALINSSGNLTEMTNVVVSPNSRATLELNLEIGLEVMDVIILAYSEHDRGVDDVLTISVSLPSIAMSQGDIGIEGEGLSFIPPDNLVVNILIIMIFTTIAGIIAIVILRRRKK